MRYLTAGVWVIATGVIVLGLYMGRDIFAPFALAIFLWLVIEGFARVMHEKVPFMPRWTAQAVAVLGTVGGLVGVVLVFADGLNEFAQHSRDYETRINQIINGLYERFDIHDSVIDPPTLSEILFARENVRFVEPMLATTQELASSFVLVLIYIAFLFLAEQAWPTKLDAVFRDEEGRKAARDTGHRIRESMEQYLWVQTAISALTTALTYVTLITLGLDNALFWAFLVFFLNYIPTVGSIIAAVLPGFFALAQPEWPAYMPDDPTLSALIVFLSVSAWQFAIGNFVQPRLMGESLNISALVVLLSLAVWGAIWGIPGMFLSAPLTVMLMIILAQVPGARWIAVLLSTDGQPEKTGRAASTGSTMVEGDETSDEEPGNALKE